MNIVDQRALLCMVAIGISDKNESDAYKKELALTRIASLQTLRAMILGDIALQPVAADKEDATEIETVIDEEKTYDEGDEDDEEYEDAEDEDDEGEQKLGVT